MAPSKEKQKLCIMRLERKRSPRWPRCAARRCEYCIFSVRSPWFSLRVYDRPLLCRRRIVCSFFSTIWMVPIKTRVALWDQDRKAYFLHLSFAFRYRRALSAIETLSALCLCARWKVLIVFPVMQRFLSWFSEKSNLKGVSVVLKWSLVTYAAVNWYTLTQRGMPYFCI